MFDAGHGEEAKVEGGFWSVGQVASYLSIKSSTIYTWAKTGEIPHYKIGKMVRFRKVDIDAWIEDHRRDGVSVEKKAKGILKAIGRPVVDIHSIVKKSIAEAKRLKYNPHHGKPDQIKGLEKEVSDGTL
jgi:excisionase family DNA binding protein